MSTTTKTRVSVRKRKYFWAPKVALIWSKSATIWRLSWTKEWTALMSQFPRWMWPATARLKLKISSLGSRVKDLFRLRIRVSIPMFSIILAGSRGKMKKNSKASLSLGTRPSLLRKMSIAKAWSLISLSQWPTKIFQTRNFPWIKEKKTTQREPLV